VPARRAINSRASSRGVVDEVIISNVLSPLAGIKPRMARMATTSKPDRKRRSA
jgi:hypothetical protein